MTLLLTLLTIIGGGFNLPASHGAEHMAGARTRVNNVASLAPPHYIEVVSSSPEDTGRVVLGARAERTVTWKNVSKVPVELSIVRKSCHCVESRFDSEHLEPGAQTTLHLAVFVQEGTGEQDHAVVVEAQPPKSGNDPRAEAEQQVARIRFTPDRMYEVRPEKLHISCIAGETRLALLSVGRLTRGDLKISDCVPTIPHLTAGAPVGNPVNPYVQTVGLTVKSMEPGEWIGTIDVTTNSARLPMRRVPVKLTVLTTWRPEPAGAIISLEPGTAKVSVDVALSRRSSDAPIPVDVTLDSLPPGVTSLLIISTKAEGQHTFRVRVSVDPKIAAACGTSSIGVVDKDGGKLATVPIAWYTHRQPAPGR